MNYSLWLPLSNIKTYLFAVLFIAGNVLFPMLFHAVPHGGHIFLPIFFFTLVGAFRYGLYVGLFTAICSPLLSHWLMAMPTIAMLPIIISKSLILASCASFAARYIKKHLLLTITLVVFAAQILGFLAEWIIVSDVAFAFHDLRMGLPGMALQIFGGSYLIAFKRK
ncbi:MAG: ECF transporter S component [Bacteroidales bacterium]|jgi:hypothetical protein|nr:ECF transporter S component [Bacteroidales bacterium]